MLEVRLLPFAFTCLLLMAPWLAQAGDIDSPASPDDPAGAMFTLQAIFDRLNEGSAGTIRGGGFVDPTSGPTASTSMNLNDIMSVAPSADLINGATPAQVLQGRTLWGLDTNTVWGATTGTMPDSSTGVLAPGVTSQSIPAGFHDGTGSVAGDADLVTENIRAGTAIFGVAGKTEVVDTTSGDAVAGDMMSGKKAWIDGSEITGNIPTQTLSSASTTVGAGNYAATTLTTVDADLVSTNIRATSTIFGVVGDTNVVDTTSGDAVTGDLATGKKAWVDGVEVTGSVTPSFPAAVGESGQTTCWDAAGSVITCAGTGQDGDLRPGVALPNPRFTDNGDGTVRDNLTGLIWLQDANCAAISPAVWTTALSNANTLANGACTLSDGSVAGDWRLPSVKEMHSVIDFQFFNPALSNAVGTGQWTSGDPFTNVISNFYWSSASSAGFPSDAWFVNLDGGVATVTDKAGTLRVWPVRGGL